MKQGWFIYFFRRSLAQRKGRLFIASASVTLAVAVVTGMLGITFGIREKLGAELKAYGANIVMSAGKGDSISAETPGIISKIPDVEEAAGQVFGQVSSGARSLEVVGMNTEKIRGRGWKLEGRFPEQPSEVLAGVNVRDLLNLKTGQKLTLKQAGTEHEVTVCGFIEKGGSEDNALIMPLETAWRLLGGDARLSAVLIRGKAGSLEGIVREINRRLPGVAVKTIRQVAHAEESLLVKIQLLMALVTAVVLFATAISVASTMGANVLERREEIGLMKALGATRGDIGKFYKVESFLIGAIGGLAGFLLGWFTAEAVSRTAFHSFVGVPFFLPFFALAAGVAISVAASYFPVRDAMKYNPAIILRGE